MSIIQTLDIRGKKFVLIPETEYRRLTRRSLTVPAMPALSPDGTFPAAPAMRAMMARKIVAARKAVGLSQVALARKAGVRVETLIDIAFGNGIFAGGGMHGLRMRSVDGLTWTDRVSGEEGEHINSMIFDGKQFVGIGQGATYLSADGQTWKRVPNQDAPTVAAFGAGVYVGALWQGRLMRSTDGVRWEETTRLPQNVEALAFGTLGKI